MVALVGLEPTTSDVSDRRSAEHELEGSVEKRSRASAHSPSDCRAVALTALEASTGVEPVSPVLQTVA